MITVTRLNCSLEIDWKAKQGVDENHKTQKDSWYIFSTISVRSYCVWVFYFLKNCVRVLSPVSPFLSLYSLFILVSFSAHAADISKLPPKPLTESRLYWQKWMKWRAGETEQRGKAECGKCAGRCVLQATIGKLGQSERTILLFWLSSRLIEGRAEISVKHVKIVGRCDEVWWNDEVRRLKKRQ